MCVRIYKAKTYGRPLFEEDFFCFLFIFIHFYDLNIKNMRTSDKVLNFYGFFF